jgi:glucose-1-phosphate thymidylyltransferase
LKAIIPLAGKGTRLRPHTYVTPKPLLRVADKPVMSYILDDLEKLGVEEAVFITGYLKDRIESYIRSEYPGIESHFVEQPVQNGTAGAVALAEPFIDTECLIIFVDTLFDADLSITRTDTSDIGGIIWAKEVEDYQRFGVIVRDDRGFMKRIVEKPQDPISKLANIGLYYMRDWQLLYEGIHATLRGRPGKSGEYYLTDAFQYMVDHGSKIRVEEVEGWYDCGQIETLLETNRHLLENGRAQRPRGGHSVKVANPVRVAEGVKLDAVQLGPNVTIGEGSVVKRSSLKDCIIGRNSVIEDATLEGSLIGDGARITGVHGTVSVGDDAEVRGRASG